MAVRTSVGLCLVGLVHGAGVSTGTAVIRIRLEIEPFIGLAVAIVVHVVAAGLDPVVRLRAGIFTAVARIPLLHVSIQVIEVRSTGIMADPDRTTSAVRVGPSVIAAPIVAGSAVRRIRLLVEVLVRGRIAVVVQTVA